MLLKSTAPSATRRWRLFGARLHVVSAALIFLGCSENSNEPASNPLPSLISMTPGQLVQGSGATTVTLVGEGFVSGSRARWNEADRVTHFKNAATLTVDLLASDLAALGVGKFTVVNGAPGGGTSGVLTVAVGYPAPTIASVTPSSALMRNPDENGSVTVTVTGTGFVSQSFLQINGSGISPTTVSATQMVVDISNFHLRTPGRKTIAVVNPAPGGGTSSTVSFDVLYPVPTISSLGPDSSFTGAAFTLTVDGSGFGPGSVVRWNGVDRTTTLVNATRVTAAIPASDVATPVNANVVVFNPTPGGGVSNGVAFSVREPSPVIKGVNPGSIIAGSATRSITITGTNFRTGATAQWNGQNRPLALTGTTSANVTLEDADIAAAGAGRLTVTNPGASGVSNAMTIAVVAASAAMAVERIIAVPHADVVYDETRALFYASVPSNAAQFANSVVRIDPATGNVTGSVAVGSNPGVLAITDDGQFLYVGLLGAPTVVRVSLATLTKDIDIPLRVSDFFGGSYAEDIVPIPGSPRLIAVATFTPGISPRNAGTYLYENATPRIASGPGHTGSNRIIRGPNANRIYGYNNETTEFGFRSIIVAPDGLRQELVRSDLVSGFGVDIEYGGGFAFATSGSVADLASMTKVGTIPMNGVVRPDAANGRVHFLNSTQIRTYHYSTFASIGVFDNAALAGRTKLIRWGTDGLAVGGGATLVLLRGGLIAP